VGYGSETGGERSRRMGECELLHGNYFNSNKIVGVKWRSVIARSDSDQAIHLALGIASLGSQ
jgi:hypothetical protein